MDKTKKIIKIVAIIIAVAAAVVGIAFAVKKIIDKKKDEAMGLIDKFFDK